MNDSNRERITIAIAAMGGQGGAVLADWILGMGENSGYYVQVTSVPGVAQRTGATIYYLELFPEGTNDRQPVLAMMPVTGDVDVVVAAELAEAGRAVQRGIVTPDRTTLIASDHRSYAVAEKIAMGDGRTSSNALRKGIGIAAKQLVCFDMQALAEKHNTVISATLFGALAGSSVLPFGRHQFEDTITATGKSVENNLAAFSAAFELANTSGVRPTTPAETPHGQTPRRVTDPEVAALLNGVDNDVCAPARDTARKGLRRLLDYQDPAYASLYLDRIASIQKLDPRSDTGAPLTDAFARHLALWMSYEDTIRVADLKIRRERFDRCRAEVRANDGELVYLTEYMHPRFEEVADTLPERAGRWLLTTHWARNFLTKFVLRERKIHTSKLGGYLFLYGISSLRRFRRSTYRYTVEQQRIEQWLTRIQTLVPQHYELAVEVALCQNLIKGYGDTHTRGVRDFNSIMETLDGRPANDESVALVRQLRAAALADENGTQFQESLRRVA